VPADGDPRRALSDRAMLVVTMMRNVPLNNALEPNDRGTRRPNHVLLYAAWRRGISPGRSVHVSAGPAESPPIASV